MCESAAIAALWANKPNLAWGPASDTLHIANEQFRA